MSIRIPVFVIIALCVIFPRLADARHLFINQQDQDDAVVAWVDNEQIHASDVQFQVTEVVRGRNVPESALQLLQAQAVEQLISQRLILKYLGKHDLGATDDDIRLSIERLIEHLKRTERTLEDYLKEQGISELQLRQRLSWRIGWENYLSEYLTEQNLEQYFEEHRMEFDGTELHAWQIFLPVESQGTESDWMRTLAQAESIRGQLTRQDAKFEELALEFSESPSGEEGGDMGWVDREAALPESVRAALFSLKQAEVSEPVRSPYGIHLLRWTESKAGEKSWREAGIRLKASATRFLFDWIADQERESAQIKYADSFPHFSPQTGELVTGR